MPPAPENKHQINHHHKAESQETDPFLSETEKGSFEKQYNENVFPFQMNIEFFCSSVHILKVRYFGLDLGIRWFDTLMLSKWLDACVCVCLCAWQNDLQSGFDADSVTTRFSIQHPTQLLTLDT